MEAGSTIHELYSMSNPVLSSLMFYSSLLILKMMVLSPYTAVMRDKNRAFNNPEDAKVVNRLGLRASEARVDNNNQNVERVRRNHLNDVENIPAFIFLSLFYVSTQPTQLIALWHFRIFTASRILHTLVYQMAVPQPARALTFTVGVGVCVSMAYQILLATVNL